MNKQVILDRVYQDEVVCLIADRYHTDPMSIVHSFLAQSDCQMVIAAGMQEIHLEENEMELLKDLLEYINKQIDTTKQ